MNTQLTKIHVDKKYDDRYTVELNVNGYRFESIAVHTESSIIKTFSISTEEFNNFLNKKFI